MKVKKQVILNWLPPAKVYFPSPSMTVLKGALKKNGYECRIVYWNILLEDILKEYFFDIDLESLNDIEILSPFFSAIAIESNDNDALLKQEMFLISIKPAYLEASFNFRTHIVSCVDKLKERIKDILNEYDFKSALFCGFSMNLYQWVASSFIGAVLKNESPMTTQVIGGIGNPELAEVFLKVFPYFDISLWGEGEISIVQTAVSLEIQSDIQEISHGFRRITDGSIVATKGRHSFLALEECFSPDFDDFFKVYHGDKSLISLPIESSRGCHWNRCKFCFLNQGYCYRTKPISSLISEINSLIGKYGIYNFNFMDNDVIGRDHEVFDNMLSELISLKASHPDFKIKLAEIVSKNIVKDEIRRMFLAGFVHVQIGYESPSDHLLDKISKKNSFASNLLFCKWASIYNINIGGMNILEGLLDETREDIMEGIRNIRFQRFFKMHNKYNHNQSCLAINKVSRYFKELSEQDKQLVYYFDPIRNFLPKEYVPKEFDWNVYHFMKAFQDSSWNYFYKTDLYYASNEFSYVISPSKEDSIVYTEFLNKREIRALGFELKSIEWQILCLCNEEVLTLDDLKSKIQTENSEKIADVVQQLHDIGILFYSKVTHECISIINTNNVN